MNKALLTLALAGLLCTIGSTPAHAAGKSEFLVFVSVDDLERDGVDLAELGTGDFTPTLDFLYTYNNGPWRVLAEYFATDDEAELERFQIGYERSPESTFWVGRFHQPISAWNHQYHHGAYLQPSISRPSVENWEDENGILPSHLTGAMFDGWRQLGENNGVRISAAIGAAPILDGDHLHPFDILDPDEGASRLASSLNLAYFPDFVGESNFGVIGGYAEIEAPPHLTIGNVSTLEIRQKVIGVQGNWETDKWHLIGAAYHVDNKSHGSSVVVRGTFVSGYFQVQRDLSNSTNAYARIERTRNPTNSYLRLFPLYVYQRELAGLRWDFANRQAAHFEISQNRVVFDRYNEVRIQWSAAFP